MSWRLASRRSLAILAAAAALAVLGLAAPDVSQGATYRYCDGCTIYSGTERISNATRYAYISYVHRLSGPSYPVTIAASAYFYIGGTVICREWSSTTEVACDPARYNVHGGAYNGGAGNYGFNAHLGY